MPSRTVHRSTDILSTVLTVFQPFLNLIKCVKIKVKKVRLFRLCEWKGVKVRRLKVDKYCSATTVESALSTRDWIAQKLTTFYYLVD